MQHLPYLTFTGIVCLSIFVVACQKTDDKAQANTDQTNATQTLTIGFQKSALTLLIARQEKILEKQFPQTNIVWKEFPAGPQLLEALSAGSLDFGFVGNTPPIFAQSAGKTISYAAYEAVPQKSLALVIPENSTIQTIQDLKGKRIALQKGSAGHDLVGKILAKAHLTWQDVTPVWLPPADARAAFDQKSVDAWLAWDPFLSVVERDTKTKVLIDGSAFPQTYQYYVANPKYLGKHKQSISHFNTALNEANTWMAKYPEQTIKYYAQAIGTDPVLAQKVLSKRSSDTTVHPINDEVIQSQQIIANEFYKQKLIPTAIDIRQAVANDQ